MIGGIGGLVLALVFILISKMHGVSEDWAMINHGYPTSNSWLSSSKGINRTCPDATCTLTGSNYAIRGGREKYGVEAYLDLFGKKNKKKEESTDASSTTQVKASASGRNRNLSQRKLARALPKLVIAGKMSVDDGPCNIAQLNLATNQWNLKARIQLSLYNSYSGGEVYYLLSNHTADLALSTARADHGR